MHSPSTSGFMAQLLNAQRSWRALMRQGLNLLLVLASLGLLGAGSTAWADGSLKINDGVVVKFGSDAGMQVRSSLNTGAQVSFTSQTDDGVSSFSVQ